MSPLAFKQEKKSKPNDFCVETSLESEVNEACTFYFCRQITLERRNL